LLKEQIREHKQQEKEEGAKIIEMHEKIVRLQEQLRENNPRKGTLEARTQSLMTRVSQLEKKNK
jgi:hypothetical protein